MANRLSRPILFQGNLDKRPYFEGWYYKQVSYDEKTSISLIPGLMLNEEDPHAFLQYILIQENESGSKEARTGYVRFDAAQFIWNDDPFVLKLGDNLFSETVVTLHLKDEDFTADGVIRLGNFRQIRRTPYAPNIMGPFGYLPNMECYHGVLSMSHLLDGQLTLSGKTVDFTGGKGYLEKDWGSSFPKDYIWLQSNHFQHERTSLFYSSACVPFHGRDLRGFICNFVFEGKEYRFATYHKSRFEIHATEQGVRVAVENQQARLEMEAIVDTKGKLRAPHEGGMNKVIEEGLAGEIRILFKDKKSGKEYHDTGRNAGIEIVN